MGSTGSWVTARRLWVVRVMVGGLGHFCVDFGLVL